MDRNLLDELRRLSEPLAKRLFDELQLQRVQEQFRDLERYRHSNLPPGLEAYLEMRHQLTDALYRAESSSRAADEVCKAIGLAEMHESARMSEMLINRFLETQSTIETISRMPYLNEAAESYMKTQQVLAAAAQPLASFLPSREEFERLVSAVRSPWVDAANALPSFESLAELAALGNAIHSAPYDSMSSTALRTALGDWSHIQLREAIISDCQARQRFYFDHGFDSRLTILPEPAFTDSLYETHILLPDIFLPLPALKERRVPKHPLDEKDAVKQRMLDAFDILFNLETTLRNFIHEVMTERFGQSWYKQRVPGELRKDWQEKRKTALSKKEREYPLLWYADFTDYIKIIEQNHNWNDVFASVFQSKMDIQTSFQRLFPIRICIAHQRPITKEDFLLLTVESHRILRAIGELPASENPLC